MSQPVTPQERAAVYKYHRVFDGYNFLSGPKGMEEIVTHDMELVSLEDHEAALQQTRRAALLEAAEIAEECKNESALGRVRDAYSYIAAKLTRLAQEGA